MTDFLLELRSEEIPARMQDKARDDLARLFVDMLTNYGLQASEIITYATPRRLALIAKGLAVETEAVSEETKGPKVGAPPQAMEGFLRKVGLTQDQLIERDGVYFAVVEKAGRKTADVLAAIVNAIVIDFPWPKSQRWGASSVSTESLRWVRPLQGIIALFGDDIVAEEIGGIAVGSTTMGHRFHHAGPVTIGNAGDYATKLRACHVIVDQEERRAIIRAGAQKAASDAGLVLVADEGLVIENAGLTEWPVPMLGRFDPAFLAVPQEVIQLTARVNQKYFVCKEISGTLLESAGSAENSAQQSVPEISNAFVCTANIVAHDGGAAIVTGNEKVLAARLSDAKFFWEQDLKVSLEDQAAKLSQITFHEKLGTVADKVERVAKLARWLVEEGIVKSSPERGGGSPLGRTEGPGAAESDPSTTDYVGGPPPRSGEDLADVTRLAAQAERAARLCKADLVTGMVGEFPELQGIMGGYYARAQGEPDAVADAVRDHYKPVGQGDDVPTAPVTVAVSLADKLDTLVGFFQIDETPTGSKDPFALRRAALGLNKLILSNNLKISISRVVEFKVMLASKFNSVAEILDANSQLSSEGKSSTTEFLVNDILLQACSVYSDLIFVFLINRLKVQQREAGVRHDLIDAVFALGGEDDLVRLLARVKALQAFVATQEGADLLAGYKRAANILKGDTSAKNTRHPELVSGSISPNEPKREADKWMLKQVQHDDVSEVEVALLNALNSAEPLAAAAIEAEDFEGAMAALAGLRGPIDAFFDKETGVMVNDPDPEKRAFRVGLLTRFRDAVCQVADFSRIEG